MIDKKMRIKSFLHDLKRRLICDKKTVFKILMICIVITGAVAVRMSQHNDDTISVDSNGSSSDAGKTHKTEYYVDISGAVEDPGVYKVSSKTRLFKLIEMAGGLKKDADIDSINQASYVKDGEKIVISSTNEQNTAEDPEGTAVSTGGKININRAGKDDLMNITGVGEVIADRIIEYRANNRFTSIEDIKNVKGIGDATFSKMKSMISV